MRQFQEVSYRNEYQAGNEWEMRRCARIRRLRRERRRKVFTFLGSVFATLCLILVCSVSYGSIESSANDSFKYYTHITVSSGETLWEIADEYIDYNHYKNKNSYIAEVQSINHLECAENLVAGQTLVVPYYSAEFVY